MAAKAKRTTVADMIAAAKLGTLDPETEVVTAAQRDREVAKVATEAAAIKRAESPIADAMAAGGPVLSATEHECGIPGCRHGASHPEHSQPDRQIKLQCPTCGAVARMTARAIGRCGGNAPICGGDGATFAPATRRAYRQAK